MTKAELIEEVSRVVEMTRKDSEVIVEAIFDSIVRSLRSGDKIEIRGFGSFRTRQRQPRVGRNPKTGTRVEVPSKRIPYFKPSKELKDLVNNSAGEAGQPAAVHQKILFVFWRCCCFTKNASAALRPFLNVLVAPRTPEIVHNWIRR